MLTSLIKFTKSDLARYPFLKESAEYVKSLDIKVEDLQSPEFSRVLERARERVEEAILYTLVSRKLKHEEIEILSFPVAIMLTVATGNNFIKERYALAEAKQAYLDMKVESKEKIMAIAGNFSWRIWLASEAPYTFKIHFSDCLRNTVHLRDKKWKLVNRLMAGGTVYLTRSETARLLSEEVRRHIKRRLEASEVPKLPQFITDVAQKLSMLTVEKIGKSELEGMPKTVKVEAFPPCVSALYEAASTGRHISHIGRFTLTSFLVNIGMPIDAIIDLFRNSSDFNERLTRYQVEHIAGERGSRTKYNPPKCELLKTHGVCTNPNGVCAKINHPLAYYLRRGTAAKTGQRATNNKMLN
ncbi:MAG: DNA primase large subunit PriL [Nitrososphaerota archaeon]|nr:DNA primase large subunit PriL [Candidatus Bathyarchaeota archaeon]MDW8194048.1 DNA primase large subunit PriL [Nitrososphaerota archaeon]